jgi:hypothetical protein
VTVPKPTPVGPGADNLLVDLRPSFPDLLSELRALGFRPYLEGADGAEILKCKGPRDPATGLVQHLPQRLTAEVREARPALIRALRAQRWERRADELFAHFSAAGLSPDEAERLAYSNLLFEWHAEHVRRAGRDRCAECSQQGGPLIPAGDGNFLCHSTRECFESYTRRWREEAADALRELGIGVAGLISRLENGFEAG